MKKTILLVIFLVLLTSVYLYSQTWSSPKRLTWNNGDSLRSSVTVDSSNGIHVVWDDGTPGNEEIFYKNSTDGGTTWSPPIRLTWNSGRSLRPSIAADLGKNLHVIWYDNTPGNEEIFFKKSTDGGTIWSALLRLTWNSGDSVWPSLTIAPGNSLHVVWQDTTAGNKEIFYKRSLD